MKTSDAGDEWFYTHKEKLKSIEKEFKAYFLTAFEIEKDDFSEQHHYRHH